MILDSTARGVRWDKAPDAPLIPNKKPTSFDFKARWMEIGIASKIKTLKAKIQQVKQIKDSKHRAQETKDCIEEFEKIKKDYEHSKRF